MFEPRLKAAGTGLDYSGGVVAFGLKPCKSGGCEVLEQSVQALSCGSGLGVCAVGVAVLQIRQHAQEAGCRHGFQAVQASIAEDAEVPAGCGKRGK